MSEETNEYWERHRANCPHQWAHYCGPGHHMFRECRLCWRKENEPAEAVAQYGQTLAKYRR